MPEAAGERRHTIERELQARWYGGVAPGFALRALAALYGFLMRLRRWAYRVGLMHQHRLEVPVIVVGNRTAGGAGKTPLVIALVEALCARGWRPGVVSRGYGRQSRGLVLVHADSSPTTVGDEPLLIHRATGIPVAVDADRVAAARALADAGCDLLVADDGLQHLRLGRVVEIEVQDGRGLGNGRVMPAGPLREPLPARSADVRVVHGRDAADGEVPMCLRLGDARRLHGGTDTAFADDIRTLSAFAGKPVHAVAGIGHPARFFDALRDAGLVPIEHPFPDHHAFSAADFSAMRSAPILMTGKDAVKCRALGLADAWEVPVNALLPTGFFDALDHRLRESPRHVDP
ncbi:MAG: tetraacyldisaccharide 4'-kinase [Silanimonas sp.]